MISYEINILSPVIYFKGMWGFKWRDELDAPMLKRDNYCYYLYSY